MRCPKTPSPAETLRPGSSRMCRRMPPGAAVCRGLWTIRGQELEASSLVSRDKQQGPRTSPGASRPIIETPTGRTCPSQGTSLRWGRPRRPHCLRSPLQLREW
jgi:hypothetical protein